MFGFFCPKIGDYEPVVAQPQVKQGIKRVRETDDIESESKRQHLMSFKPTQDANSTEKVTKRRTRFADKPTRDDVKFFVYPCANIHNN